MKFSLIPRAIGFKGDKAVGSVFIHDFVGVIKTINLPTDHYDFPGPINVAGKTEQEIKQEVEEFMRIYADV